MLYLILNNGEAFDKVLGEIKFGLSQLSHKVLSHTALIKSLEACLLALSTQTHNPTRDNYLICMAITTGNSNPYKSSMRSNMPLFGKIEKCERSNKGEVNESNNILDKLESICDIEDGDWFMRAEMKMIEGEVTPQKLYVGTERFTQQQEREGDKAKFQNFLSIFTSLAINIPLVDALNEMPTYS